MYTPVDAEPKPSMRDSERPKDSSQPPRWSPSSAPSGGPVSLEGIHGTVAVPHHQAGFWEQWRAFLGPGGLWWAVPTKPPHTGAAPRRGATLYMQPSVRVGPSRSC